MNYKILLIFTAIVNHMGLFYLIFNVIFLMFFMLVTCDMNKTAFSSTIFIIVTGLSVITINY